MTESATKAVHVETEMGRRIGWSRKHDNRLVQNDETVVVKIASFEESFNKIRSFSSLDLMQSFTATAQGEIMGIGGSVTSKTEAKAHTELETETFNRTKKEIIIDDSVRLFYPGPIRLMTAAWWKRARSGWWTAPSPRSTR